MNSIWNNNIQAFKQRFPSLAQMLLNQYSDAESLGNSFSALFWELSPAKNGQTCGSEKGLRLCSNYNPEREASGAVNTETVKNKSTVVFYGFGLGYHVIEAARLINKKSAKTSKLVIIEPDAAHFFASLEILDWTEVFKVEQLVCAVNCPAESVLPLIEDTSKINIDMQGVSDSFYFDIPAFTAHCTEYFNTLRALIQRNQRKNEINAATLKKFGSLWERNCSRNRKYVNSLRFISSLKDSYSHLEIPFIIAGAGPSLERVLPDLREIYLKKKAVIICVETALKSLLRNGISPDFIILTDPQFWAYRHIAGLSAPESILITELSTYPSVFHFNCKEILLCASQFPYGQQIEQEAGFSTEQIGDLGSGGSVASCCWNFAQYCGAKTIYLAGLDLGFPGGQTHIRGCSTEQTWHSQSNRLSGIENNTASTLHNASIKHGTDYNNNALTTDSRMKMFAWWFESRIAACRETNPELKTYTLCKESLMIPGIETADISELK